jgi:hypothetical protein
MTYQWRELYGAAMVEIDRSKLAGRIEVAHQAIQHRLRELEQDHGGSPEERQAISDALLGLDVLRKEASRISASP